MVKKVLQIVSWVHVHSLSQAQHVHTYKVDGMCAPTIERCGSLNHIWNEKIREDNRKAGKTSWTICQMPI